MSINFSSRSQMPNSAHSITVTGASDGGYLPLDQLAHTFGFSGGLLTSDSVTFSGFTYIQSITYSGTILASVSDWVKQ